MRENNKKWPLKAGASIILSAGILLGSAATPFDTISTLHAEASVVSYQTTSNLNMRQGASTKSGIILTIPKGKQVSFITQNGAWFKVKYASKEGWVSSSYLKKITAPSTSIAGASVQKTTSYQTTANLNLRSTASTKGSKVLTIPKGKEVTYISKKGNWYNVKYGNKTGWVSADYVKVITKTAAVKPTPSPAPTPAPAPAPTPAPSQNATPPPAEVTNKNWVTTVSLNMRNSSSTAGTVLATIPKGTVITSSAEENGWYKVSYSGKTGYVSKGYLYEVTEEIAEKITALEKSPYLMMDLRTKSSVTAEQINRYLIERGKVTADNSVLYNSGQLFINAANKYGVNALYLAAHAIHESGFGKSAISKAKYNLFGFGAFDSAPFAGAMKFNSIASNIEYIAQEMKATYLNSNYWKHNGPYLGYKFTDEKGARINALSKGMNYYYASDPNWSNAMAQHMERILPSSQEAALKQQPNTQVPSKPAIPDGKDVFPAGTLAVANAAISLYDTRDGKAVSASIPKGETFNLLEKWNDYSLTVQYNGRTYYTAKTSFSGYNQIFTVKNLARVNNTASLNVRDSATTSGRIVGKLINYPYVELVMDENQKPIIVNGWYNIKLNDGTSGWVSGSYLVQELNR